jgi:hypothetical protein
VTYIDLLQWGSNSQHVVTQLLACPWRALTTVKLTACHHSVLAPLSKHPGAKRLPPMQAAAGPCCCAAPACTAADVRCRAAGAALPHGSSSS